MINPEQLEVSKLNTEWDWEDKGFRTKKIAGAIENSFSGEITDIRLYKDNGRAKWIFIGRYHNQPIALAVGRYSSDEHYKDEHRLLGLLHTEAPQFFPYTLDSFTVSPTDEHQRLLTVGLMECLDYMDSVFAFKEKRRSNKDFQTTLETLTEREGYAAGFVLGRTDLVATDPHPSNTLVHKGHTGELKIKFIDGERFVHYNSLGDAIDRLLKEYTRESCIRLEVIRNTELFMRGLEQGLQDADEEVVK